MPDETTHGTALRRKRERTVPAFVRSMAESRAHRVLFAETKQRREQMDGSRTNKNAAPEGGGVFVFVTRKEEFLVFGRPGSDLLSQGLSHSTIGAEEFNGRVRDGIGLRLFARATRPAKHKERSKLSSAMRSSEWRVANSEWKISIRHSLFTIRVSMDTENESNQADRTISTGKLRT